MTISDIGTLSEAANEQIFQQQIVPLFLDGATAQEHPIVVIVGGQTGAGKTSVTAMIKQAFGSSDKFVNINMDFYNPLHPSYQRWRSQDENTASAKLRPDGERWWNKAQAYAIEHRLNVVLESAMHTKSEFEDIAQRFHDAGYRVEIAIVAVPAALSRLGILSRYQRECQEVGHGRLIEPAIHDACYAGVLRGAIAVDSGRLAHSAFAFRRNGEVLYSNHTDLDGNWAASPSLARSITAEFHRTWTPAEHSWFDRNLRELRSTVDRQWLPEVDSIAALAAPLIPPRTQCPADAPHLAALAFPVPTSHAVLSKNFTTSGKTNNTARQSPRNDQTPER